jgi:hypothetical protein
LSPEQFSSGAVVAATPGQPSIGPSTPPDTPGPTPTPSPDPNPTPNPNPNPGGGGTGSGTSGSSAADAFAGQAASVFFDLIRNAASPDALEAQNIIMRRMALEGDVAPSSVPDKFNITEIGGWINLLTDFNELEMRQQVIAGILGVAGPNPPLGWTAPATAIGLRPLVNDRPAGPAQASLPVTVMVRIDFYDPLLAALKTLHDKGCVLPLLSGPLALPTGGSSGAMPPDPLDYMGRTLLFASSLAMVDPDTDALALVRPSGTTQPYVLAARSSGTGTVAVAPANYDALTVTAGTVTSVAIANAPMVMLGPVLATAGFSIAGASPLIGGAPSNGWARFVSVAGLQPGTTTLGTELGLLHSHSEIAASLFAAQQDWVWNGTAFAP